MPQPIIAIVLALYGLIFGSFVNALVWRLHEGKGIARGERSECPNCRHTLAAQDLIPVISWLWLRGKCRYCHKSISWQYPIVEVATAVLFALSYWVLRPVTAAGWFNLIVWLLLLVIFMTLTVYDFRWLLLPNKLVYPAALIAATSLVVQALVFHLSWGTVWRHGVAGLGLAAAFYILASVANGKLLGGGDVKFGLVMGLILGLKATLLALIVAFDVAALIGVILIAAKIRKRTDYIAFGPFLVLGTIVAYLYGPDFINWYLRLNGLH